MCCCVHLLRFSQLRPALRAKLQDALKRSGAGRAGALEEIKRAVLHELDADPQSERQAGNYANIDPRVEQYVSKKLGLKSEKISSHN